MDTLKQANAVIDYVSRLIDFFHANPELSGIEYHTSKRIIKELKKLNIEFETVDEYSVIAHINKGKKNNKKTIAFRAQMPGVPLQMGENDEGGEKNIFHARGNDILISVLLGVISILNINKEKIKGHIIFIFESHARNEDGPVNIVKSNILKDLDYIFWLTPSFLIPYQSAKAHLVNPGLGSDEVIVNLKGVARPSSLTFKKSDPILAATDFITSLNRTISMSINPAKVAVVSATKINGGTHYDVTAGSCELTLNIRYQDMQTRKEIYRIMNEVLNEKNRSHNITSSIEIVKVIEPFINDLDAAKIIEDSFIKINPNTHVISDLDNILLSNVFSYYLKKYKGTVAMYGLTFKGDQIDFPCYDSKTKYNREEIKVGIAWHLQIAYDLLT